MSNDILQRGNDNEGLLGFLEEDIKELHKKSADNICVYCLKGYATLKCCYKKCRKIFHLPCGIQNNSMSQFYGSFNNFCSLHKPIQKIPQKYYKSIGKILCSICYSSIKFDNSNKFDNVLWAPCCKKTWYHKFCIQVGFFYFVLFSIS